MTQYITRNPEIEAYKIEKNELLPDEILFLMDKKILVYDHSIDIEKFPYVFMVDEIGGIQQMREVNWDDYIIKVDDYKKPNYCVFIHMPNALFNDLFIEKKNLEDFI